MPLLDPVPLLPADQVGAVHFIGIGGAGMSGIAAVYALRGIPVSGSDQADSSALSHLAALGITTHVGHAAEHVGQADTVVISTAVRETNPELAEARRRGLRVWHRSAALAALMLGRRGIAVSGTHGKTTTSGMIAVSLAACGADPSYVVGSPLGNTGLSYAEGGGPFVVEADESDGSFRQYPADIVVVTNVEADHLDNWETPENYAAGFAAFATGPQVRTVVLSADDPGSAALVPIARAAGKQVVTYGETTGADVELSDLAFSGTSSSAWLDATDDSGLVSLQVPGRHNLHNAAAAYAVGRALGLAGADLRQAAGSFAGTHRRFQRVAEVGSIRIFDDYAHHPTELVATLTAAQGMRDGGRLVACFQPHLFSRTRDYAEEFGVALALADLIVVMDVYPSREDPIPGVTGELVAQAASRVAGPERVTYSAEKAKTASVLAKLVRPGDLVLTLGAGDVTRVGPALADLLAGGR